MTETQIYELMAIVGQLWPNTPPDEKTVRLWVKSKRLRRARRGDAAAAIRDLADHRVFAPSLAEICDETGRVAARRIDLEKQQKADLSRKAIPAATGDKQMLALAASSIVVDKFAGLLPKGFDFEAELEKRRKMSREELKDYRESLGVAA